MAGSGKAHMRDGDDVMLRVDDLVVEYPAGHGTVVHAVSGISFDVVSGETLGIVGESGCGKSTTGRAIIQLPPPTHGSVQLQGEDLTTMSAEEVRRRRPKMQMIFQDPLSSLNPRRRLGDSIARGLRIWGVDKPTANERAAGLLESVGLDSSFGGRRPSECSGGQAQRVSIARALALDPNVLICDEPVSALDVSVQAQILNLLEDMKARYGLTMVFISHDLGVVKHISDRVLVMYLGKVCEVAPPKAMYAAPAHHYTHTLLASIPRPDVQRSRPSENREAVELPSPIDPPSGCRFRTRCPAAKERCAREEPELRQISSQHFVACHFPRVEVASTLPASPLAGSRS